MVDPKDILSAAEREAIEARVVRDQNEDVSDDGVDVAFADRAALLRHLDAIAAPADGEALGREVRDEWVTWAREQTNPKPSCLVPWEGLSEPDRDVDRRIGLRCHAIGHAAGALSREGEIAALVGSINAAHSDIAEKEATIARLTALLNAARDCGQADVCATPPGCQRHWEERNRELAAQLAEEQDAQRGAWAALCDRTAELVEARATLRDVNPQIQSVIDDRDEEIARLEKERDAARADGARNEREAIRAEALSRAAQICPDECAHDALVQLACYCDARTPGGDR